MADSSRGWLSVLDTIARIGAEDLQSIAVLADGVDGGGDRLVVGVAFDVDEEEVSRLPQGASPMGKDSIHVMFTLYFSKGRAPRRVSRPCSIAG